MSDLPERFQGLARDLDGLPRPGAAEVRRAADRAGTARVAAVAAAVTLAVTGTGLAATRLAGDGRPVSLRPAATPPAGTRAPSPVSTPQGEPAWLPPPWRLAATGTRTWAAGAEAPFDLCGRRVPGSVRADPVTVTEQRLVHPSGRRAHLLLLTPDRAAEAVQLWKLTYATCLVPGRAEGVGGPRNLWSYGDTAGASDFDARAARIAEVSGPGATRADAAAALDAWRGR